MIDIVAQFLPIFRNFLLPVLCLCLLASLPCLIRSIVRVR